MAQFWRPQNPSVASSSSGSSSQDNVNLTIDSSEAAVLTVNRHKHLSLQQQRQLLPINRYRNEILYALETYRTLVLVGETGCGKSTQIPQFLHEAGWTADSHCIVCTQPRRMAAVTVATRVADEFGCVLGNEVGY